MIKYILHGGNTSDIHPDNDAFFHEMTIDLKAGDLILLNYFAREEEEIEACIAQDEERILKNSNEKNLSFEVANPDKLAEQLSRAKVMYMRGGETAKLKEKLNKTKNLKNLFEGEIIAGSSAGVHVLAKYYWSNDYNELREGLGIINFKVSCHYDSVKTDYINELINYQENLLLVTLPNCKWIVLYN